MDQTFPFYPDAGDQLARREHQRAQGHVGYVYNLDLILAVNAALATGRPLLLRGNPGCGKSTAARDIAFALDREYLEEVVTSKTAAADLLWRFDAVGRLSDAGADGAKQRDAYVEPGVLWRGFQRGDGRDAVVLLDEIDKADPDVPNDLLVPLGEGRFTVSDADKPMPGAPLPDAATRKDFVIRQRKLLVILTSNGERELPPAFLRRCVALTIDDPDEGRLELIGRHHLDVLNRDRETPVAFDPALLRAVTARAQTLSKHAPGGTRRAGTAEILDAFKAAVQLGITSTSPYWEALTNVLLYKEPTRLAQAKAGV